MLLLLKEIRVHLNLLIQQRANLLLFILIDLVNIRINMNLQSTGMEIKMIYENPIYIDHVNPFGV